MDLYKIICHPRAGGIPDISRGNSPGRLGESEKNLLRELGKKVAEISTKAKQAENREQWYRHNSLQKGKPLLLVYPEDSWYEIIPVEGMVIKDSYWRQWEWYLRHLIYRDENIFDDYVTEPELVVPPVLHTTGWGLEPVYTKISNAGSFKGEPPIKNTLDINKLSYPQLHYDKEETENRFNFVSDVFNGVLPVEYNGITQVNIDILGIDIIGIVTNLRGIENVMIDIYDRPEWLHELICFVTNGVLKVIEFYENNGLLRVNNKNHYIGSGGLGYTKELPSNTDRIGQPVSLRDMWGLGIAQEFSEVSSEHHEEFLLNYQLPILERFGLVAYGCCEPYTKKFNMLHKIKNLRKVSISPWCNIETAAKELEDKWIYSWKPNPCMLAYSFDPEEVRSYINRTLETCKGCILEIILKDTITLDKDPERLKTWIAIARDEMDKACM